MNTLCEPSANFPPGTRGSPILIADTPFILTVSDPTPATSVRGTPAHTCGNISSPCLCAGSPFTNTFGGAGVVAGGIGGGGTTPIVGG